MFMPEKMMTRGGKKPAQEGEPEEGAGASSEMETMATTNPEDKLEELAVMVKSMMRSQVARDLKIDKDFSRQEQRWKSIQHQFQQMQLQVHAVLGKSDVSEAHLQPTTSEAPTEESDGGDVQLARGSRTIIEPKFLPLSTDDDIEHFLTTFERMAQVCRWARDEWAVRLVPLLTGKARTAYVLMDMADSEDYEKVKEAILAKYEITADTYRRRFRCLKIEAEISEQIILEQFLRMVNPELEIWIRERDPKTAKEAATLAEVFTSARKGSKSTYFGRETHYAPSSKSTGGEQGSGQSQARNFSSSKQLPSQRPPNVKKSFHKSSAQDIRCYNCNGFGHTQHFCPALKSKPSLLCSVPRPAIEAVQKKVCTVSVLVNGQKEEALLDSGCFQSLVHASLISEEKLSGVGVKIKCVHGDEHVYPSAEVYLTVGGQTYLVHVAVVPSLPYSVILGNDIPTLFDLIHQSEYEPKGLTNREAQDLCPKSDIPVESLKPCNIVTRAQSAKTVLEELPFYGESLEIEPGKTKKSRAQKRMEKFKGSGDEGIGQLSKPNNLLEFDIPSDVGALQRDDPTLKPWFEKVTGGGTHQRRLDFVEDAVYIIKGGILYQKKGQGDALALPQQFRYKVMELGHSIPWAGHMAFHKTLSRISADWDQWLPYLLFAYREVPQVSTGFSPFELLYGRQVRGPLDLLKDCWEDAKPEGENIAAYVINMRERLQEMASFAQDNLKAAQQHQKTWYDQKARDRVFLPGQKVLLLLPTSDNKLLTKWHGPYEITKQVSKVVYELYMPERAKKHQTFHVNLLKEFRSRQEPVHQELFVRAVKDEEVTEKFLPTSMSDCALVDVSHLSPTEQEKIKPFLDPQLFKEVPGFTSLVQHKIRLKEDAPSRQKSYRIPERLVPVLEKEIKLMLELGIIEESRSEWCSPIVLVPKKDASLRFCIDFRHLNAVSNFDPYPMPRVDDLLEKVGSASYITTLDLCKGYWQVALAPEARELTAFKTPFAYLDDVVVYSRSWEEHLTHLQEVLHRIRLAGLTVNPKKCNVAKREVEYLGFVIGFGKIKPQVGKMDAIHSFPVPTTKKKGDKIFNSGKGVFGHEMGYRGSKWLRKMRDANARIAGWYLALQPFDFTVQYKPGKANVVADCLSRMSED
ncbi:uncharacterized protein LOC118563362 [Fundulus heteroclitus]|uniref:uncharacterized protein LOC118563362 n=1 Tax=Fundulus heteroclitus TaxID=8078 RepID=UPI00165A374B|nr:uncharacterized protein LOC118563362 [Fundulus heteroclitus]